MDPQATARIRAVFEQAIADGSLPGAVLGAATHDRVLLREAMGSRQVTPTTHPMTLETVFDLASLTKVVATTSIFFRCLERGMFRIDDRVSTILPGEFGSLRLEHLLTHTSGLPAWMDLLAAGADRGRRLQLIAAAPRSYAPGAKVVYSDVNFILLGYVLEIVSQIPLDRLFEREVANPLGLASTGFLPLAGEVIAATETDVTTGLPWVGIVHDENARAAGGVLGHAGLFGTVDDLIHFGQALLNHGRGRSGQWLSRATVAALAKPRTVGIAGELRAWGYQKPHPMSSAGDLMSDSAIGHTGFTGTSLWVDFDYDVVMVALTNRVHFGRQRNAPIRLRPIFHNMVLAVR